MDSFEKYLYWEDIAQYDIDTAESMFKTGRYLYVAFMCQQSIEKLVKGLFVYYNNEEPLKTHNINLVFKNINWPDGFEKVHSKSKDYTPFFVKLLAYYIAERYPSYKENLSNLMDKNGALEILKMTKEVFAWLKSLKR